MSLKTFVKVANVSSLSDARYCSGMGVDILGFNLSPASSDRLSETDYKEITEWVAGVQFAGEFTGASLEEVKETLKSYPVDFIEVDTVNQVEPLFLLGKPLIFKLEVDDEEALVKLKSTLSYLDELCKIVIIRSGNPDLYESIDQAIAFYNGNVRLVKGYGISATVDLAKFPGIEMEATKEEKPGFKDYGDIMDVLESLETD